MNRIYRFQPGEAVSLVDYSKSAFCRPYIVNPASVLKVSGVDERHAHVRFIGEWVTVQPPTTRSKIAAAPWLLRGLGPAAGPRTPGPLVCPVCHCLAIDEPPPQSVGCAVL